MERMAKFELFIKDNDVKRQKALSRAQSERKLQEIKDEEIRSLKDYASTQRQQLDTLTEQIKQLKKYEYYLLSAVQLLPAGFVLSNEPQISDMIARYGTLIATSKELSRKFSDTSIVLDSKQQRLSRLYDESSTKLAVLNAELNTCQRLLDAELVKLFSQTKSVTETQERRQSKLVYKSECALSISNLYTILETPPLMYCKKDAYQQRHVTIISSQKPTSADKPGTAVTNKSLDSSMQQAPQRMTTAEKLDMICEQLPYFVNVVTKAVALRSSLNREKLNTFGDGKSLLKAVTSRSSVVSNSKKVKLPSITRQ
jgi:hypothetical protein